MTFGEKMKTARKDASYTQEQLAELLGVSRAAVAKWESDRGLPDVSNLRAIAGALNVSVDYLLGEGGALDFTVTRRAIDFTAYDQSKHLSRLKKVKIKEQIVRAEYPEDRITRLTVTGHINTKAERILDWCIGWFALLLAGLPLFDTQEMGKIVRTLDEQYYLVDQEGRQLFVLITDEHCISRALRSPITDKRFIIGDKKFLRVGTVE